MNKKKKKPESIAFLSKIAKARPLYRHKPTVSSFVLSSSQATQLTPSNAMPPSSAPAPSASLSSNVTVLRVKRPRTRAPLSELHVALPTFKRRAVTHAFTSLSLSNGSQPQQHQHVRFRRLAALRAVAALSAPGVNLVDVHASALRRGVKRDAEESLSEGDQRMKTARLSRVGGAEGEEEEVGGGQELLCNGVPMARVPADEEDLYVQDGQRAALGVDEGEEGEEGDDPCSDGEYALVRAEDLPELVFEEDASEEEEERDEEDDLDGESVDYPSTPESGPGSDDEEDDDDRRRPFGVGTGHDSFAFATYRAYVESEDYGNKYEEEGDEGHHYHV